MKPFTTESLETAFVSPAIPTFADLLASLSQDASLSLTRRRDLRSGLNRVAKALGRPPNAVPADPRWLQPRLHAVAPKLQGISSKTWSNAVSDARAAMAKFGILKTKKKRLSDLNPVWRPIWQRVLATGERGLTAPLCQLVHFLSTAGVSPAEVTHDHLLAYRDAISLNQIRRDPDAAYRNAIYAWNRLKNKISDWPGANLVREPQCKRTKLPLKTYPASFSVDLDLLCEKLTHPDPFDDDHFSRPMRDSSVLQYRRVLERFAAVLVHDGISPDLITSVEFLLQPAKVERGLRWMLADYDGKLKPALADTARVLKSVSKRHSSLTDDEIKKLGSLVSRLSTKKSGGMTKKNRERLRPLLDQETKTDLFRLPDQLFEDTVGCNKKSSCLLREQAIAIAILSIFPIRRGNLVSIVLDRHLQRPKNRTVFLVFEPDEVKNRQRIECQLPQYLVEMIDQHITLRSPNLCPAETQWLFPRRDGSGPMAGDYLAKLVTQRLRTELGLTMNMHLFRHFAANMMLEAHPGNYEATRRLLGHARLSTTLNFYTGFENTTATRLFGELVSGERCR